MPGWGEDKVRPQWWGLPQVPSSNTPLNPNAPPFTNSTPSLQTTLRRCTPTFSSFLCGRLPSPALASAARLCLKNAAATYSPYHPFFFSRMFIAPLYDWPMLLFGGLGEARRQNACLHCFLHLARFLNRLEQLTARLRLTADRMSTLCAQIVHKRTQTLFLVSHTFLPEQNATRAGRIKSIITQCLATGSSSKLSSCQSSLWLWNLQNPHSRVGFVSFTSMVGRKTWKFMLIYSVSYKAGASRGK